MQPAADLKHGHLSFGTLRFLLLVPRKVDSTTPSLTHGSWSSTPRWHVCPDALCLSFDHIPACNSRMFGVWGGP